ncbi:MAG: respiratory nitrate reductase subunit gamma [Dehalococcoidales bacterium]
MKVARMPIHLRWELYPVTHDRGYKYGGSYFEELEWWTKPLQKSRIRSIIYLLKQYLFFWKYFQRNKGYWFGLYPWHTGFYLIVSFHILSFFGALAIVVAGLSIAADSVSMLGRTIYYLTLVVAVGSFILGSVGSIGLLVKRLADADLRAYASPMNYFNYLFFLAVFLSGLIAWYFFDPSLSGYREFWKSLITFRYMDVEPATYTHIMLFSLFLIYLPFTRSTHYITKILAFFWVRWDDAPNVKGSEIEERVKEALNQPVSWSAPHIQTGKKWSEVAKGLPEDTAGVER